MNNTSHSRSSDAGPICRAPHYDDVQCVACNQYHPRTASSCCQGAVPDNCASYLCEACEVKCWGCNLPVCEEHRQVIEGHVSCDDCRRAILIEAITELAAAALAYAEVAA